MALIWWKARSSLKMLVLADLRSLGVIALVQRVEGQAAEQFGIEISAFGRHSLFVETDCFDVLKFCWHHEGGECVRFVAIALRLTSLPANPFDDLRDFVHIGGLGVTLATQQ